MVRNSRLMKQILLIILSVFVSSVGSVAQLRQEDGVRVRIEIVVMFGSFGTTQATIE